MSDDTRWNPTPPGWKPIAPRSPRARGEEAWRLVRGAQVATCELRNDSAVGAGWEVLLRHDDEIIVGRRCRDKAEARYVANAFRQDYEHSGWSDSAS